MKTVRHKVEAGSDAYYKVKIGVPSCSGFSNIVTPSGSPTTGDRRRNYMDRLIAERLLECSFDDRFENYWTRRGKQMEAEARSKFIQYVGMGTLKTEPGGFITAWDGQIGYSPDHLFKTGNAYEAVEIKCLAPWNHIGYMREGPGKNYKPQVQGGLLVGGFDCIHFWSYHPQCPPVHVVTLRDDKFQRTLVTELTYFVDELHSETERVRKLGRFVPSASVSQFHNELTQNDDGQWGVTGK